MSPVSPQSISIAMRSLGSGDAYLSRSGSSIGVLCTAYEEQRTRNNRCGLDVHQNTVVACLSTPNAQRHPIKQVRTFRTIPAGRLALGDWLRTAGYTHVAMEATGVYWKPVYHLLKDAFALLGGQCPAQQGRAPVARRMSATLNRSPVSSRMALCVAAAGGGHRQVGPGDDQRLGNIRSRPARGPRGRSDISSSWPTSPKGICARNGRRCKPPWWAHSHHTSRSYLPSILPNLAHIDHLDEAITPLDTMPGIRQWVTEGNLAEIGTAMGRIPSAKHLASWVGMCPGNHERARKQLHGTTRKGSPWLRQLVLEAAHAAARANTSLGARYRRLAKRRGPNKVLFAVAHSILVICFHLLQRPVSYHALGTPVIGQQERAAL